MSKRANKNYNSALIETLCAKPIAFNPVLAEIADSALAGLFLSQLLYWWGKGSQEGWIYKTIKEIHIETCMTRSEQSRAIRIWKGLGVIEVEVRDVPPKRHFKINLEELSRLIEKITGKKISIPANQFTGYDKLNRRIRQNTTESTPESTNRNSSLQEGGAMSFDIDTARRNLAKSFTIRDS